jgi:outer membrane receptor protein involved in Fe transport
MGQSNYVINGTLAFDQPSWGTNARLLYNTFGKRISRVGGSGIPDTYEQPFSKVDFSVNQKLSKFWGIKLQATNLLNSDVEYTTGDQPFLKYKLGRSYALGLSYVI